MRLIVFNLLITKSKENPKFWYDFAYVKILNFHLWQNNGKTWSLAYVLQHLKIMDFFLFKSGLGNDEFWSRILTMAKWEQLLNKEVAMILPSTKWGRKTPHFPKTSDKLNIYNLNDYPNNVKILNFGYLLLKGKLMQNVEYWQKQDPIKIPHSPYICHWQIE